MSPSLCRSLRALSPSNAAVSLSKTATSILSIDSSPFPVLLHVVHELEQILAGEVLARNNDCRGMRGEADRLEIAFGIVLHIRGEPRRRHKCAHPAGKEGISIGIRRRYARASDRAARAAYVLDDQCLPQDFSHLIRHDASHHIARTASGERHYHRDGFGRITAPLREPCCGNDSKGAEADEPNQHNPFYTQY